MNKLKCVLVLLFCWPFILLAEQTSELGEVTVASLLQQDAVFRQHYVNFSPDSDELKLMQQLTGKRLVVLFGRWCHDSQREVPKLLKLLSKSAVKLEQLTLIAVDQQKTTPKQLEQPFALKYTPTIILFDQQRELGRIIETPQQGIAADLAAMVSL